jgi:hypothetical protein
LISGKHVNLVYNKTQRVFRIFYGSEYNTAYLNQLYYLKDYHDMGFLIIDILDEFSSPFMDSSCGRIKIYGNPNKSSLIEPITN